MKEEFKACFVSVTYKASFELLFHASTVTVLSWPFIGKGTEMKEKRKLSLFVKLMSGFMSIVVLLLLFALYSVTQLGTVGGYFDKAYTEAVVPMDQWAQFKLSVAGIKGMLNCHIVESDLEKYEIIESGLAEKFESASQLLEKLGTDAVSKEEIAIIDKEKKNGANHSVTDFSKESQVRLMASIIYHWNEIGNISKQVTEYSKNFMKEDASAILNTGRGQEMFSVVNKATSAVLGQANKRVADYRDRSLQLRNRVQLYLIVGGIFAVLISLLLSYFLSRSITKPVRLVVAGLKDIAEGERDLTKRLQADTRDEVGELAAWFNIFIKNLQAIMKELADTTESLSKSSEELSAVSAQMALSAEEMDTQADMVAASSEQISASVATVASSTEQASFSVSNIASMTEEMSSSFNNVARFAEKTDGNVKQVAKSGGDMRAQIDSVASSVEEMTASLNEVAKNTAKGS
ncbi:MAG: methyl-accepting chemotaxis protein, partial [Desulfobacteraceae bacterium]|nr:methyl-accepting chemotaxis protein [Desulfobacteraceae bacterium]